MNYLFIIKYTDNNVAYTFKTRFKAAAENFVKQSAYIPGREILVKNF